MQSFRGASWVPKILSDTAIILSLLGWKSFNSMLNEKIIQVTDETNKMKQEVDYWLTYFIASLFFGYVFTAIFGIFWDVFIFDIVSWLFNKHCRQFFFVFISSDLSYNPTVHFFAETENWSPRLNRLNLIEVNLSDVSINALPSSLKSLAITDSFLPFNWFQPLSASVRTAILLHLKELDLSKCTKTNGADLDLIARAWRVLRLMTLTLISLLERGVY